MHNPIVPPRLVLASTSPFRGQQMQQLRLPYETAAPHTDETPLPGEPPADLARRLARAKAHAVADQFEDAVIIGADQVGVCAGRVLGKPADAEHAVAQLYGARGKTACFYSGVAVLDQRAATTHSEVVTTALTYRDFSRADVERYIAMDAPLGCAGSFKAEGLGIALFTAMSSDDPSALIGLPLIALVTMLARTGITPFNSIQRNA